MGINWFLAVFLILVLLLLKRVYQRDQTTKEGAPFVPLEPDVVGRIITMANIKKGDVFYDLGSGDGRLVIAAAMKGAKAYGVEIDPVRVLYSRLWIVFTGLWGRAKIINKSIYDVDLSKADIVTAYLLQNTNNKLQPKLQKELKKGTKVIGVAFKFPKWKPVKTDPRGPIYGPLYFYELK